MSTPKKNVSTRPSKKAASKKSPSKKAPSPKAPGKRTTPASSPQSTTDRRAAETQLRAIVTKFAPEQAGLVTAMRKALRTRLPTAHELVYEYRSWFVISYSPSEHGFEGVLAIRGDADGVKFYFNRGKELPDPDKLLQGSAQVRFIDMDAPSTLSRPAVATLIEEAIARNPVAFPADGDGSVIIRSAAAKKK